MYYLLYLVVIKRLNLQADSTVYSFTSSMFSIFDVTFKAILLLGCFYFIGQDLQQIKSLSGNQIVLWSYANSVPLVMMMFAIVWDRFFIDDETEKPHAGNLQKTLYSLTAFVVWLRVVHLLKCFTHTAYLLRMATAIVHRIRWLIALILISLAAFGFTYFFVDDSGDSPYNGVT